MNVWLIIWFVVYLIYINIYKLNFNVFDVIGCFICMCIFNYIKVELFVNCVVDYVYIMYLFIFKLF